MATKGLIGDGYGQVDAIARYHAMRQTPRVAKQLDEGRLVAAYSGIDRRKGAQTLQDLDYVFMPATALLPMAGRLVDSLVARDGADGAKGKSIYVEVADSAGATHRLRVATTASGPVGRLTGGEVDTLLGGRLLSWSWSQRDWQLVSFPAAEFQHPPLVLIAGRPATQSLYAAVTVSAWEAQLIELLRRSRKQE